MMATSSPYRPSYGANDWTARLPPGSPSADPGMAVQPYTDPGYGMPNAYVGNLNQSPGVAVGGYLQASGTANPVFQPGISPGTAPPQNRLAPWSNFGAQGAAENDYWLEQARRLAANPEDYGKVLVRPTAEKLADLPAGTARVPRDRLSDVDPTAAPAPVDVGAEGTSPIYPSNPTQLVDRLINYDTHSHTDDYATAIQRAMENRRRLGRQ